jgi:hypothetical protein
MNHGRTFNLDPDKPPDSNTHRIPDGFSQQPTPEANKRWHQEGASRKLPLNSTMFLRQ